MCGFLGAARLAVDALSPGELATLLWSLSRLGHAPDLAFMDAWYRAAAARAAAFGPGELALALHALGALRPGVGVPGSVPGRFVREVLPAARRILGACSGAQLAQTLWGLAELRLWPGQPWLEDWLAAEPVSLGGSALAEQAAAQARGTGAYTRAPAYKRFWRRPHPLEAFVDAALALLAREGRGSLMDCGPGDATLPTRGSSAGRVAIVSNLRNAAGVAPNAVLQVLRAALWLPQGAAFVLVYEDGSTDATRRWLALLQLLLTPVGVPFKFTLDGGLARRPQEPRIAHLARIRNALVDPLFPPPSVERALCSRPRAQGHRQADSSAISASASASASVAAASRGALLATSVPAACFRPDALLFINDVFFCRDDALRLMLHDADLACGFDS
ncbi:hypothetical protein MNEG_3876 [Monoraphidium neglectum]|uniref:Uncharacterized protein n=1 Tax=Monoraphidium neglectum TaxID=145388 RepID=A0A0D2NGC4_9CHLO|nr:hypothetical protein MNEG_3876 [Monoraphidium neglectum]KIZ04086.1 hypothetical protein MNEG_3876 [Monoraphidium neglectum]|eukprot:XP_013903105.1 hypothetical protein MNEG_3876 [Monoraphidium neglectum]